MDDLFLSDAPPDKPFVLSIHHVRVLKLVARGHGQLVKLPLKFKFDHRLVDEMVQAGILTKGDSGWPGVPAYRLTAKGSEAEKAWLTSQVAGATLPYRSVFDRTR